MSFLDWTKLDVFHSGTHDRNQERQRSLGECATSISFAKVTPEDGGRVARLISHVISRQLSAMHRVRNMDAV